MVARIISVSPIGFDGKIIEVESDATRGLPSLQIVGMGNKSIDEARERVRSAITNSFLEYPAKRITINLAPAELPKNGTHFDLPIALSILVVSGQLRQAAVDQAVFAGELALDGAIRPIRGVINIAEAARSAGFKTLYVPAENATQARLVKDIDVIGTSSIKQLFLHLTQESLILPQLDVVNKSSNSSLTGITLDDIYGQDQAKRALVIATAGRHNILFTGPPGTGKTMLAQTIPQLLPPLTDDEQVAVTKLYSLGGEADGAVISHRPFRSPHHSASRAALIGGGSHPKPGEVSLAHLGVLFLDELPEYATSTLEALRQPLEDRSVSISRVGGRITYPADFMLVGTMNPCPCGYYGDRQRSCSCSASQILAYQKRLSGPLLDRIDLIIPVTRVPHESLLLSKSMTKKQQSEELARINTAILQQSKRYNSSAIYNSSLSNRDMKRLINLAPAAETLLIAAAKKLSLSTRSYFKLLRVAQTIADLESSTIVTANHVSEALQYRGHTS